MNEIGKVKVKKWAKETTATVEASGIIESKAPRESIIPVKNTNAPRTSRRKAPAATTSKKSKLQDKEIVEEVSKTTSKNSKVNRTTKKESSNNQRRIDSFFKSSTKTYQIKPDVVQTTSGKAAKIPNKCTTRSRAKKGDRTAKANCSKTTKTKGKRGRKRLFEDTDTETVTSAFISCVTDMTHMRRPSLNRKRKSGDNQSSSKAAKALALNTLECIDLCTDSEQEEHFSKYNGNVKEKLRTNLDTKQNENTANSVIIKPPSSFSRSIAYEMKGVAVLSEIKACDEKPPSSESTILPSVVVDYANASKPAIKSMLCSFEKINPKSVISKSSTRRRKPRPCPPYKIVAGTTFAVDAFQYAEIAGVTHYFLTHFHADHYIGLTRKFAMPLYLSPITAQLVRSFIPVENQYLHEINLNEPINIAGVEVTAIDANHCPGAIMLLYKLPCGKCILHTGDFRASAEMESEPIFWNHDIDTIYLDTTYISNKYAFCTQYESIDKAMELMRDFQAKHAFKRILYICGSYVIGKEKFWSKLADEFNLKVWTEANRLKALKAMAPAMPFAELLCDNPYSANMHIIGLGTLNYMSLVEYVESYSSYFDVVLAIRPSGWEKNSRPQYRGKINIVGVEYSEHSSYNELERFVSYLKPQEVISTVPVNRNPMICGKVPQKWYKYDCLKGSKRNFQTSITSYMKLSCVVINSNGIKQLTTPTKSIHEVQISPLKGTINTETDSQAISAKDETENRMPIKRSLEYSKHNHKPKYTEAMHANNCNHAIAATSLHNDVPIDLDADAADDWMS